MVFAIYVSGDSMEPRYRHGDLLYAHKGRPPRPGDDVIVELNGADGMPGECYVKRLVKSGPRLLVLRQFNPPRDDLEFPAARVRRVYRVLTINEMMGYGG